MKKLIIFDFDGTIVDTITDVGICFNKALEVNNFPQHPLDAFNHFVGGDLETVVSRMLPQDQVSDENIDNVKKIYRDLYLHSTKPNTKPYVGIMPLLDELKFLDIKLAINSNKGQVLLEDMVEKMFPLHYFDACVGYLESRPSKPDAYGVELILQQCGCDKSEAVYVGDGHSDIETARNAEIPCVFVTWGQGVAVDRNDRRIAAVAESTEQLRGILKEI